MDVVNGTFTYHRVGQGLFFSGKVKFNSAEFNFVYDCGSESFKQIKSRIDNFIGTLPENNEYKKKSLNLLIISHFHADHVNGLDYLLDKVKVDTVIIPYISPKELLLYAMANTGEGGNYYELLSNPFKYLINKGVEKIIVIGRGDGGGDDFNFPNIPSEPNTESFNYDKQGDDTKLKDQLFNEYGIKNEELEKKIIPKSHSGYSRSFGIYLFRFFNVRKSIEGPEDLIGIFKEKKLEKCLSQELGIKKLDISILKDDKILEELTKKTDNKFKKCYENSFGEEKLNLTSLVLFNMPLLKERDNCEISMRLCPNIFLCCCPHKIFYKSCCEENCGHFLTGDADLKNSAIFNEFKTHYDKVLDKSLIFQLPHHGSEKNWNSEIKEYLSNNKFFVASAGINNKYNHPSRSVISEIASDGKCPIFVNEQNWFKFDIETRY